MYIIGIPGLSLAGILILVQPVVLIIYAALSMMKWMYKKGDISKIQYKEMLRLCSPFLDTSGLMPEVVFLLAEHSAL